MSPVRRKIWLRVIPMGDAVDASLSQMEAGNDGRTVYRGYRVACFTSGDGDGVWPSLSGTPPAWFVAGLRADGLFMGTQVPLAVSGARILLPIGDMVAVRNWLQPV